MRTIPAALKSIVAGALFGVVVTSMLLYPSAQPEVNSYKVSSRHYDISEKQAIQRSTNSSVRVFSLQKEIMGMSALSGTYFAFDGEYFVLTSAHGIISGCDMIIVKHLEETAMCQKIVALDRELDYAIIKIPQLGTRKPIKIPRALANWRKSYNLLDRIYYTGYPNSNGPTTWTGTIAGFSGDYLILQTYAWSGASGSGVFDERGDLIGIIMALDVGRTEFGIQILENFVIVVPIWKIDFATALME